MTVDSVVYCWCSEIISRSTLKVVWGQRDTRRDGALGMTLQKLCSLPFSLHCLWPCVPSSLVCGVNTLLSNALLSRLGVTVANCLVIGDFYMVAWGKKLFFFLFLTVEHTVWVDDTNSLYSDLFALIWVVLLLSLNSLLSYVPFSDFISGVLFMQLCPNSHTLITTI